MVVEFSPQSTIECVVDRSMCYVLGLVSGDPYQDLCKTHMSHALGLQLVHARPGSVCGRSMHACMHACPWPRGLPAHQLFHQMPSGLFLSAGRSCPLCQAATNPRLAPGPWALQCSSSKRPLLHGSVLSTEPLNLL